MITAKLIFIAVVTGLTLGTLSGIASAEERVIDVPVTVITAASPKAAPRLVCGPWIESLAGGRYRNCAMR